MTGLAPRRGCRARAQVRRALAGPSWGHLPSLDSAKGGQGVGRCDPSVGVVTRWHPLCRVRTPCWTRGVATRVILRRDIEMARRFSSSSACRVVAPAGRTPRNTGGVGTVHRQPSSTDAFAWHCGHQYAAREPAGGTAGFRPTGDCLGGLVRVGATCTATACPAVCCVVFIVACRWFGVDDCVFLGHCLAMCPASPQV